MKPTHEFSDGDGNRHRCTVLGRDGETRFMAVLAEDGALFRVHETKIVALESATLVPIECQACGRKLAQST